MKKYFFLIFIFPFILFAQENYWDQTNLTFGGTITALTVNSNSELFAGSDGAGMFFSTNNGDSWQRINNGLTDHHIQTVFADSNGKIYAGTNSGLFFSTDNGGNWSIMDNGLPNSKVQALTINSAGDIFVGFNTDGIYRSSDNGNSWLQVSAMGTLSLIVKLNDFIYAGTYLGPYRSTDNGVTWEEISNGFIPDGFGNIYVKAFAVNKSNGNIFAGMLYGTGVFKSTNDGNSWTQVNNGLGTEHIYALVINPNGDIFAASELHMYKSSNNGSSWNIQTNGGNNFNQTFLSLTSNPDGVILTGTNGNGIFSSSDSGENWSLKNTGLRSNVYTRALAVNKNNVIFTSLNGRGLFRSDDDGNNWININNGIPYYYYLYPLSLANNSDSILFAGFESSSQIFRSTDNGNSWASRSIFSVGDIDKITIDLNNKIFVGTYSGIYRSTNNGDNWMQVNNGLTDVHILSIRVNYNNNYLLAGTANGVFISLDSGDNWSQIGDMNTIDIIVDSKNYIFIGTPDGIYRSSNNGNNWEQLNNGLTYTDVLRLGCNFRGSIFAGTNGGGVYVSSDQGNSWKQKNQGLLNGNIYCFIIDSNGYLYAGTWGEGVFRSNLSTFPIQILSPNGGENFETNTTASISWIHSDSTFQNVKIEYTIDSCKTWNIITEEVNIDSESYNWMIPNTPSDYCKIRISDTQDSIKYDISDKFFTIRNPLSVNNHNQTVNSYKLFQNYPNPFNPSTKIGFRIAESGFVILKVYDVLGREVAVLVNKEMKPGNYNVKFDGSKYPSGIYFYKLNAGSFTQVKKMILIK